MNSLCSSIKVATEHNSFWDSKTNIMQQPDTARKKVHVNEGKTAQRNVMISKIKATIRYNTSRSWIDNFRRVTINLKA